LRSRKKNHGFIILIGFIGLAALSFCLLKALSSHGLIQNKIEYQSKIDACLYETSASASQVINSIGRGNSFLIQLKHLHRASYMIDIFFPGYGKTVRYSVKKIARLIVRFQDLSIYLFDISKYAKILFCCHPLKPLPRLESLKRLTRRPAADPEGHPSPLRWRNRARPVFKTVYPHKDFLISSRLTISKKKDQTEIIQKGYRPQYL
jgi:hypothetical protein